MNAYREPEVGKDAGQVITKEAKCHRTGTSGAGVREAPTCVCTCTGVHVCVCTRVRVCMCISECARVGRIGASQAP